MQCYFVIPNNNTSMHKLFCTNFTLCRPPQISSGIRQFRSHKILHVSPVITTRWPDFCHIGNRTPTQIWQEGMLQNQCSDLTATEEVCDVQVDLRQRVLDKLGELTGEEQPAIPPAPVQHVQTYGLTDAQHTQLTALVAQHTALTTPDLYKVVVRLL